MDAIDRAIGKGSHITGDDELNKQTWDDFEEILCGRKVYFFGVGTSIRIFLRKYEDRINIAGIIDNDVEKQGYKINDFVMCDDMAGNIKIDNISVLTQYSKDQVIILISSINYYQEITLQLRDLGFIHIYSIFIMEANERLSGGKYTSDEFGEQRLWAEECCKVPINKKKILFTAYGTYTDHGKYITEQLLKIRTDLDIVWVVNNLNTKVPKGVRLIHQSNNMKVTYETETAAIWVTNVIFPHYIVKRSGQTYIETKHWASVTLKCFYLIESSFNEYKNTELVKYNGSIMDYIITGSDFDSESCRRGFDFHKEVVQIGSPRSDAMFRHEELRKKVYEHFQLDQSKKMVVYAPTFRYKKGDDWHIPEMRNVDLNYELLKDVLEKKFGGEWYVMLRLHPGLEKEVSKLKKPPFVIDASRYDDGQEIAAACDVMISDYSSIMFEPAFVHKPVFLFATDMDEYTGEERDLLIDYNTLPFPKAKSNEELAQCILEFDEQNYKSDVINFLEKYGVHEDGHASERAAAFISDLIGEFTWSEQP